MKDISGFAAIADENSQILILGSMPSEASLQKREYYGHTHNAFWPIMLSLFNNNHQIDNYSLRKLLLIENNIAVWDVLQSCNREGSLDSAIKMKSIKVNNFFQFFTDHRVIKRVFFNGAKAETIYTKYVLPNIYEKFNDLNYTRLPSTSPAHASMSLQQKIDHWSKEIKAKEYLRL